MRKSILVGALVLGLAGAVGCAAGVKAGNATVGSLGVQGAVATNPLGATGSVADEDTDEQLVSGSVDVNAPAVLKFVVRKVTELLGG